MDFLKQEIARKRQEVQEKLKAVSSAKPKTFFKRSEVEAKLKRAAEEEEQVTNDEEPNLKKDKLDEPEIEIFDALSAPPVPSPPTPAASSEPSTASSEAQAAKTAENNHLPLTPFEVTSKLRERRLPIRLFGETDVDAFERLRRAEMSELSDLQPGFKNEFKAALDKLDEDFLADLVREQEEKERGGKSSQSGSSKFDVHVSKNVELEIEKWMKEINRGETYRDAEIALHYLKHILNRWGQQLNSRSFEEKAAYSGRLESARHATTCEYIRPLFKMLRTHVRLNDPSSTSDQRARAAAAAVKIDTDMLDSLAKIVGSCLRRDYLAAGDAYVELAIGNACWPLGVTNHGIHARTAQEKIHAKNVAHVLNDENQRKFIQAVKRLLTIAETFYPPGADSSSSASRDVLSAASRSKQRF